MREEDVPKLATWNEENKEWRCKKCNSIILGKEQILSMHMQAKGAWSLAGFGETIRKVVPYCPKCETESGDTGIAHYGSKDDPDVQDMEHIRRMAEHL